MNTNLTDKVINAILIRCIYPLTIRMQSNLKRYLIILILLLTAGLGFVEWEDGLGLELRSHTLIILANGALAFGALTLLFSIGFIWANGSSVKGKILKVILAVAGFISAYLIVFSVYFYPDPWHDVALYKYDNDYLIIQFNSFGLLGERTEWRLITTKWPDDKVRSIIKLPVANVRRKLGLPEFDDAYIANRDTLTLNGKLWHLQQRELGD